MPLQQGGAQGRGRNLTVAAAKSVAPVARTGGPQPTEGSNDATPNPCSGRPPGCRGEPRPCPRSWRCCSMAASADMMFEDMWRPRVYQARPPGPQCWTRRRPRRRAPAGPCRGSRSPTSVISVCVGRPRRTAGNNWTHTTSPPSRPLYTCAHTHTQTMRMCYDVART